jgi:NAD(P)-dependent dehydrogenase (short-subunit alcohol dehydrogenase family)
MKFDGNVFLVSGASSGLGAATAQMLASRGALVLGADVREPAADSAVRAAGVKFVLCDITREQDCAAAVEAAAQMGPLRGLVGCAGVVAAERTVGRNGPHALASFERVVAVNLVGMFNLLRLAAARISQSTPTADGERGVIVNTASIAAYDGQVGQAAYAASKGGVAAMTLPIARDLSRSAIRCVTIAPGVFETPMTGAMNAQVREALEAQVPFPSRLGRAEEFARLALALIENPYINGEVVRLDGALRMPFA